MTQLAYTVSEFCRAFRISERHYFNLRDEGKGPKEFRAGRRVLISVESAQAWLRARELEGT
ncbi:helix-turn-helix domain-containing protein [Bradyrhizobium sp. CCGUVB1N3]|uniref:helix-turn-helix domain-containing protein n=1 Tax=Bradyrhizobium sp. CCGUVB1N3 TaxID=2949629 RepID=UPI0020B31FA6|nr:helix-turn-helix domain-containing protein [Bradyrhizobium sp. CCGUVB1N3]MCP3471358.1 helix-turn-helix domain-containing protein [Bradyrhizobium sp. CCGUVB1N3]